MNPTELLPASGAFRVRRNRPLVVSLAVGLVALVVGVVVLLTADTSGSFGWFAYAPMADTTFSPDFLLLTTQGQIGLLIGIIGLAIMFFCAGWAFGGRRRTDRG